MGILRRILGVFVMIAGVIGLLISIVGLVGVWVARPIVTTYVGSTINTLNDSITTSKNVMGITGQALGATVDSLDALSAMLETTANTVNDTSPVVVEIRTVMSDTLPTTFEAATSSLKTAQDAATVLESTIKSLDTFRFLLSANPLLGNLVGQDGASYNPDKPLADSLGELAVNLEKLPETFVNLSGDLSTTDNNLTAIHGNLTTMSQSVGLISSSLEEYKNMVNQSQSSMDNLSTLLTNIKTDLAGIINGAMIVITLLLLWFLATQVVILSQGWELYQGTADRMEGKSE
jgi:uncharacterized protein YukE